MSGFMDLINATDISKIYTDTMQPVAVLSGLDFALMPGELVGVFGESGSGKSTLLHILGGIDSATRGKVVFEGKDFGNLSGEELARIRNRRIGFVFQFYHLLREFTALENIMLPALISGEGKGLARDRAFSALEAVGLSHRKDHRPPMLSGGEQQRIAVARAAVMSPALILADEPTGNLDHETGEKVFEHLLHLNDSSGVAMVIVTHNRDLLKRLPRAFELSHGRLHEISLQ